MKKQREIIGSFAQIDFPEFGLTSVLAKIDTGAYTGAMHCTKIYEKEVDGSPVLFFSPFDHPEMVKSTDKFFIKDIKSSNGQREQRYLIDTLIELEGKSYPMFLTLADRSDMDCPVLIGRRFLRKYNFLVDVKVGTEYRELNEDKL